MTQHGGSRPEDRLTHQERVREARTGGVAVAGSSGLFDVGLETEDTTVHGEPVRSQWRLVVRRFFRHRLAVISLLVLIILGGMALFADVISPYEFNPQLDAATLKGARQPPSWEHLGGTDKLGRDQFTRVLYALQKSLQVGLGVAFISVVIGVIVGSLAGYYGGWIDQLLMRFTDLVLVLPALAVLLIMASNPDPSFFGLVDFPPATTVDGMIIVIAILAWMPMARIVRGEYLSLREKEYVEAARAAGAPARRIVFRHLLPNALGSIVVFATLAVGAAIITEATLSFLGAGIQLPDVSLGNLISDAEDTVGTDLAYLIIVPGLVLFLVVLCVNFVGDGLRDALDPSGEVSEALLSVDDLRVEFGTEDGLVTAVNSVSFSVARGETLAIVGESGSGKSVSALSVMGLIEKPGRIANGDLTFAGRSLRTLSEAEYRKLRGGDLAMIFQDPLSSLNPAFRVGDQIAEALLTHTYSKKDAARRQAAALLDLVGIPQAGDRARDYPHQFSGGMRQRAMIAMAIANKPQLLIADEPTTALDVTIQAQVLEVLKTAQRETDAAMLLITHDLGVVAGMADRVVVMYAGRIVEEGTLDELFYEPRHPYTLGLLNSLPRLDSDRREPLRTIPGTPPSVLNLPSGCALAPRCPYVQDHCRAERPDLVAVGPPTHRSACFRWAELPTLAATPVEVPT